ncbi:MAG TPA: hypothetical protein VM118_12435 [Acidobacteriota bacterium]|nr:hypothetical protein [Acidobacteriota bacterium]
MKKLLLIAVAGLLMTSVAMAQTPVDPVGIYEVEVWTLNPDGTWDLSIQPTIKDPTANARCFASNKAAGNCNKYEWVIPVTVHASVAQWIDFTMTGTRWDWFVKKPGWYAANCITAKIASNGDINIDYDGFDDLLPLGEGQTPIPIWYAFGGSMGTAAAAWVPALMLNEDDDLLDESDYWSDGRNALHEGLTWKLWNRIHVVECNTACEYEDVAAIILTLRQQKPWIEQEPEALNYGTYINYGDYFGPLVP